MVVYRQDRHYLDKRRSIRTIAKDFARGTRILMQKTVQQAMVRCLRGSSGSRLRCLKATLSYIGVSNYYSSAFITSRPNRAEKQSHFVRFAPLAGTRGSAYGCAVVESLSRSVCICAHHCYFRFAVTPWVLNWIDRACGSVVVIVIGMETGQSNRRKEPPRITYSRNRNECGWKTEIV
jgi:hypothetical protein